MKKLILTAVILAVFTTGVFAEGIQDMFSGSSGSSGPSTTAQIPGIPTSLGYFPVISGLGSPTSTATQNLFKSDADNYISPNWFKEVDFDTVYLKAGFNGFASLGTAVLFNGIHIAASYDGTLFGGIPSFAYSQTERTDFPKAESGKKWVRSYKGDDSDPDNLFFNPLQTLENMYDPDSIYGFPSPESYFNLLAGIGDMGVLFSLYSNFSSFNRNDLIVDGDNYKNYQVNMGTITPAFTFGFAKDMLEKGVRPYVQLAFAFNNYNHVVNQYDTDGTEKGKEFKIQKNYFSPSLTAGMGGFTILENDSVRVLADVTYKLDLAFNAGNKYNGKPTDAGKFTTLNGQLDGDRLLKSSTGVNYLFPSAKIFWDDGNRISLAAGLDLGFIFTSSTKKKFDLKVEDLKENKLKEKESYFSFTFAPRLNLGMQFNILPEKLSLNAGGFIDLSTVNVNTTTTTVYSTEEGKSDDVIKTKGGSNFPANTGLNIGLLFNLTENVTLEAMTGVNGNAVNIFPVFDSDREILHPSVFSFASIVMSLKF